MCKKTPVDLGGSEIEAPIFVDEKNAVVLHHCLLRTTKSSFVNKVGFSTKSCLLFIIYFAKVGCFMIFVIFVSTESKAIAFWTTNQDFFGIRVSYECKTNGGLSTASTQTALSTRPKAIRHRSQMLSTPLFGAKTEKKHWWDSKWILLHFIKSVQRTPNISRSPHVCNCILQKIIELNWFSSIPSLWCQGTSTFVCPMQSIPRTRASNEVHRSLGRWPQGWCEFFTEKSMVGFSEGGIP